MLVMAAISPIMKRRNSSYSLQAQISNMSRRQEQDGSISVSRKNSDSATAAEHSEEARFRVQSFKANHNPQLRTCPVNELENGLHLHRCNSTSVL